MKIEFKPGYYEWHLFIDNKFVYSWGDILDDLPGILTKEEVEAQAWLLVRGMQSGDEEVVNPEIEEDIVEVIANELYERYGDEINIIADLDGYIIDEEHSLYINDKTGEELIKKPSPETKVISVIWTGWDDYEIRVAI